MRARLCIQPQATSWRIAGVDDRIAGAALLPGLERVGVVGPLELVHLGAERVARDARVVQQHVGVEVAPRELAAVDRAPRRRRAPLLEAQRRQAAEVQVLAHARGRLGQRVAALGVALDAAAQPALHRRDRGRLARLAAGPRGRAPARRSRGPPATGCRPSARACGTRHAARRRGAGRRRPAAPRRGGTASRRVNGRPSFVRSAPRRRDEQARARARRSTRSATRRSRARAYGRGVPGGVDGAGARLGGDGRHDVLEAPDAHDQPAAALAQLAVERPQAVEQVLRAVGRAEAPAEQAGVEHEQRHDLVVLAQRGDERRVVVHPQVAPEPDDGRHHHGLRRARRLGSPPWPTRPCSGPRPTSSSSPAR